MVGGPNHNMFFFSHAKQNNAEQREARESKRCFHLFSGDPLDMGIATGWRNTSNVGYLQVDRKRIMNNLGGNPILRLEGCAQSLVPANNLIKSPVRRINIENSSDACTKRYIIGCATRHKPIQKPQPLLRKRKRSMRGTGTSGNRLFFFALAGNPLLQQQLFRSQIE